MNEGWKCSECGTVYAPWVRKCECVKSSVAWPNPVPRRKYPHYPKDLLEGTTCIEPIMARGGVDTWISPGGKFTIQRD